MTAELISSPPVLAAGNWIWLLAPPRQDRALVIAPANDALPGVLAPHFNSVERVDPNDIREQRSMASSIDFVAISRLEDCAPGEMVWLVDALVEAGRVLQEGGCVLVTFMNPFWGRRYLRGWGPERLAKRRRVLSMLRGAGFSRLASYYVQPFPEVMTSIIPAWAPAAEQHERVQHVSSRIGRLRPLVARLGAHALLYPGCACVGFV